jgi:hypothetical protein
MLAWPCATTWETPVAWRGQQVVDPLAAEVGGGEEAVGPPQVGLAGVRHGKGRHAHCSSSPNLPVLVVVAVT